MIGTNYQRLSNIMPEDMVNEVDVYAEERGVSRTTEIRLICRELLLYIKARARFSEAQPELPQPERYGVKYPDAKSVRWTVGQTQTGKANGEDK